MARRGRQHVQNNNIQIDLITVLIAIYHEDRHLTTPRICQPSTEALGLLLPVAQRN